MATKDSIISLPNEHLRQKSRRIAVVNQEILDVIEDMKSATLDWESTREHELGVALAAVQIDKLIKVVVVRNDFDNKKDQTFSVFINPEVVKLEGEVETDYEGCLSVPDVYGKVPRHTKVRVKAIDEQGRELRVKAEGFLARVFQHEIDHTKGVLFVDHIKSDPTAFYKLTKDGKLVSLPYAKVKATGILR